MVARLINRLKEPSTYAGLAAVALVLGYSAEDFQTYANAAAGLCAFLSIILAEAGSEG